MKRMHTAGLLTLRTNFHGGRLVKVDVALRRPAVAALFVGKTADEVVTTVPLLYSVCAQAQQIAAQAALDGAVGRNAASVPATGLWMEMLHETLWRVLLDWPPALGLPAANEAFVAWRRARLGDNAVAVTQQLCRGLVSDLSAKCLERIPAACAAVSLGTVPLGPSAWLDYCLGRSDHLPTLQGPASIRLAYERRIAQLHEAVQALASQTAYPVAVTTAPGWGVAQVGTARGILTHAAHVRNGRVSDYRVWAPTDVFFADNNALLALLGPRTYASVVDAKAVLKLAVLALDPCVPFEVECDDA